MAIEDCIAPTARIPVGRWCGGHPPNPDGIGLLVLQGLLVRYLRISGRASAELLGEADLLRPLQETRPSVALSCTTVWRVLEPVRIAVLDSKVACRFARYPQLAEELVARELERSQRLAINMAIVQQPRVYVRLYLLLWHLADRWGYVGRKGTVLTLNITHDLLADLVAARRPSVSSALSVLARAELVRPDVGGWLLLGERPAQRFGRQYLSSRGSRLVPTTDGSDSAQLDRVLLEEPSAA